MDSAKGVGARVARPNKTIPQMKGLFNVLKRIPMLYAVPTTAGTGSEATLAAVISNSETHEKYAINDANLFPRYAVLDPMMTVGLPPHITSTTGMDALTHAIEAYVGRSNTDETHQMAKDAVKLIFANVKTSYLDGKNLEARANMLRASYLAGMAFTRAYVGYIHAIAHTLGGFYRVPHGLANAVIMPYVLDIYGEAAYQPLSELSDLVGLCDPKESLEVKAKAFISAIRQLNKDMDIPDKITGILDQDIPLMVERADSESNPLYPVPKILFKEDLKKIYALIKA
jgi:alcohol dehydrogenase class IV